MPDLLTIETWPANSFISNNYLCTAFITHFTMEKGTLTFHSFLKGTRPECDWGSDPNDAGDHQLLPDQLPPSQPQPGVRSALQARSVRAVSDSPLLPGHHAKYRPGEWYVTSEMVTLPYVSSSYSWEVENIYHLLIAFFFKCWIFLVCFLGLHMPSGQHRNIEWFGLEGTLRVV